MAGIPKDRELAAALADEPFVMLGINSDSSRSVAQQRLDKEKMPWPQIYEGKERTCSKAWNVSGYPTYYLFDHEGKIRYRGHAAVERALVDKLVADAKRD